MMDVSEKVHAHDFSISTRLSPPEVIEALGEAAEVGKRFMQGSVSIEPVPDGYAAVIVGKGPGGLVETFRAAVDWSAEGADGRLLVTLRTGEYLTTQTRVMFIPIGPKTAPGLDVLSRFSRHLQDRLTDRGEGA